MSAAEPVPSSLAHTFDSPDARRGPVKIGRNTSHWVALDICQTFQQANARVEVARTRSAALRQIRPEVAAAVLKTRSHRQRRLAWAWLCPQPLRWLRSSLPLGGANLIAVRCSIGRPIQKRGLSCTLHSRRELSWCSCPPCPLRLKREGLKVPASARELGPSF